MNKIKSNYSFDETISRLIDAIEEKELSLFYTADHEKNSIQADLNMPGAVVLFFGNPKVGTLLMLDNPEISLELPLRIAVFMEDQEVFVMYRVPTKYAEEFEFNDNSMDILSKMDELYDGLTKIIT